MSESRVQIDVWSDYNCPWCFLASNSLEKLESSHNVDVEWHSYELRPKGSPPISEEYLAMIKQNTPRLMQIAREQYGLELSQGRFGVDSRPALAGAKFAEAQGLGKQYHHTVMNAYWIDGKDIADREVLADLAVSIGLDRDDYLAALDDAQYDNLVQLDIDQAKELGLNSVPAMVFDNRYLISGAQPYPVLVQATEKVLEEVAKRVA